MGLAATQRCLSYRIALLIWLTAVMYTITKALDPSSKSSTVVGASKQVPGRWDWLALGATGTLTRVIAATCSVHVFGGPSGSRTAFHNSLDIDKELPTYVLPCQY
jgi:hypothetical protein